MKFLIIILLCTLMPQLANSATITFTDGERLLFGKSCYSAVVEQIDKNHFLDNSISKSLSDRYGFEYEDVKIRFGEKYSYANLKYVDSFKSYAWFTSGVSFDFSVTTGEKNGWVSNEETKTIRRRFSCLSKSKSRESPPEVMAIKELNENEEPLNLVRARYYCNKVDFDYIVKNGACYLSDGRKAREFPSISWSPVEFSTEKMSFHIMFGPPSHEYSNRPFLEKFILEQFK